MVAPTLDQWIQRIFDAGIAGKVDPWFVEYCTRLKDPLVARRQFSYRRYLVAQTGVKPGAGVAVLDAGCGFGPNCLAFHLMGFRDIHGIDLFQPMVDAVNLYLPVLGLEKDIHPVQGDVTDLTRIYGKNRFDLIFSNEALSHYHDVDLFLREAHAVLKPGGVLLISDNNNGANPKIRAMNQRIWDVFENGPPQSVYTHTVKTPYIDMRRDIIRSHFPDLDAATVNALAEGTFLMHEPRIVEAVKRFLDTGEKPDSRYRPGVCPLNPVKNEVIENLFDPRELARQLSGMGFDARGYAYLGGATRGGVVLLLNRLWQALSPLTLPRSNVFFVVARKR